MNDKPLRCPPPKAERQAELDAMSPIDYLSTPEWQQIRTLKLRPLPRQCERCGSEVFLQVHHLRYSRRGWESEDDLEILCGPCHKQTSGKALEIHDHLMRLLQALLIVGHLTKKEMMQRLGIDGVTAEQVIEVGTSGKQQPLGESWLGENGRKDAVYKLTDSNLQSNSWLYWEREFGE